jgi:hypothetical protein
MNTSLLNMRKALLAEVYRNLQRVEFSEDELHPPQLKLERIRVASLCAQLICKGELQGSARHDPSRLEQWAEAVALARILYGDQHVQLADGFEQRIPCPDELQAFANLGLSTFGRRTSTMPDYSFLKR